jgi:hypothetical protein
MDSTLICLFGVGLLLLRDREAIAAGTAIVTSDRPSLRPLPMQTSLLRRLSLLDLDGLYSLSLALTVPVVATVIPPLRLMERRLPLSDDNNDDDIFSSFVFVVIISEDDRTRRRECDRLCSGRGRHCLPLSLAAASLVDFFILIFFVTDPSSASNRSWSARSHSRR